MPIEIRPAIVPMPDPLPIIDGAPRRWPTWLATPESWMTSDASYISEQRTTIAISPAQYVEACQVLPRAENSLVPMGGYGYYGNEIWQRCPYDNASDQLWIRRYSVRTEDQTQTPTLMERAEDYSRVPPNDLGIYVCEHGEHEDYSRISAVWRWVGNPNSPNFQFGYLCDTHYLEYCGMLPATHRFRPVRRGSDHYQSRQQSMYRKGELHGKDGLMMISTSLSYVSGYNSSMSRMLDQAHDLEYERGYADGKLRKDNASNATTYYLQGHLAGWRSTVRQRTRSKRTKGSVDA